MNSTDIRIEDGALFISGRHIKLAHPIVQIKEWRGHIVARIEPPAGEIFNRNVFCFTRQGNCIWQIEESPHGAEKDKPYVGILIDSGDALVAANWNGVDYFVNANNGKISTKAFDK